MDKLLIEGKFKEDFEIWIAKEALNYGISYGYFKTFDYLRQVETIHKFLNNESYGTPFVFTYYSIDKTNELIQEYNDNKLLNEKK